MYPLTLMAQICHHENRVAELKAKGGEAWAKINEWRKHSPDQD
jgi:hypothetical protein